MAKSGAEIALLPSEEIKPPWDAVADSVQHPFATIYIADAALDAQVVHLEAFWILVAHWIYKKKYSSRHKLPVRLSSSFRVGLDAWADVVHQFFKLATVCHSFPSEKSSNYKNGAERFNNIVRELKNAQLKGLFKAGPKSKKESVSKFRKLLKDLREDVNPFNLESEPHTFWLIEDAIRLERGMDGWSREHWKPFLKAWGAFIYDLDRNEMWRMIERGENGKFVGQKGRGKYKPVLTSKIDFLEPL